MRHVKILQVLLICVMSAQSAWAASSEYSSEEPTLRKLFAKAAVQTSNPARHTFVIWVNGDADHFVAANGTDAAGDKLYRGDAREVEHLQAVAQACGSCNVILFHDQRGSSHWYTANGPWATYLRVFSRGQEVLERHVDEIDETNPRMLAWLLSFAQASFPDSELHLIYRGHSFRAPYYPGSQHILPFDYSAPEHGYSEQSFVQSIAMAGLKKPLASVTFASCSMSSLEIAGKLAPYAHYLVATEVDVLETLDVGFRFDFLLQVSDWMGAREVSYGLASRLLEAFRSTPEVEDAMYEFPATWMDLRGISVLGGRWNSIVTAIQALPYSSRAQLYFAATSQADLVKSASTRFVRGLEAKGKSPLVISLITSSVEQISPVANDLDLGLLLETVETYAETSSLRDEARSLKNDLSGYVHTFDSSSNKLGLSVSFEESRHLQLPSLSPLPSPNRQ